MPDASGSPERSGTNPVSNAIDSSALDSGRTHGLVMWTVMLHSSTRSLALPLYADLVYSTQYVAGSGPDATDPQYLDDRLKRMQLLLSLVLLISSVFDFLSAGARGALCDSLGRRPIAVISLSGKTLEYAIALLCAESGNSDVISFQIQHTEFAILAAAAISGASGSLRVAAQALLSDLSPASQLPTTFGKAEASWGIGMLCGPVIGTVVLLISGSVGMCFGITIFVGLVGTALVVFGWPNMSVQTTTMEYRDTNPFAFLTATLGTSCTLRAIAGIYLSHTLAYHIMLSTMPILTKQRFNWGAEELMTLLGVAGILAPVFLVTVTRVATIRGNEHSLMRAALVANLIGYLLWFVTSTLASEIIFASVVVILCFGAAVQPLLFSIAVPQGDCRCIGRLFSALAFLEIFASALAPVLTGALMPALIECRCAPVIFLASCCAVLPAVFLAFCFKFPPTSETAKKAGFSNGDGSAPSEKVDLPEEGKLAFPEVADAVSAVEVPSIDGEPTCVLSL